MKRIVIFVLLGLVLFGIGFGGGLVLGRSMASSEVSSEVGGRPALPGPVVTVGEFTSNLAGSGKHIISFTVSLETVDAKAAETVSSVGWLLRIKNEILMIVKDKVYEDLTSAEGALQFAEEIKRSLNAKLPEVRGEVPIVRVLFETFVLR